MRWQFAWLVAVLGFIGALGHPAEAQEADAGAQAVVVVLTPAAASLDEEKLRAAVGHELGADAVGSSDARASSAMGTVTIDIDRTRGVLIVSYVARAAPILRRIPLPPDANATRAAAVSLAGNLARDEAGELVDELGKPPRPVPPAPPPPSTSPAPPEERASSDSSMSPIHQAIDYSRRQADRTRIGLSVASMGLGAGLVTGGIVANQTPNQQPWLLYTGIAFSAGGLLGLAVSLNPFDELATFAETNDDDATEAKWAEAARSEVRRKRLGAILSFVVGGFFTTIAVADLAERNPQPASLQGLAEAGCLAGPFDTFLAAYELATDGPLESSLRAYEAAVGHGPALPKSSAAAVLPKFGVVPTGRGAMGTVGFAF